MAAVARTGLARCTLPPEPLGPRRRTTHPFVEVQISGSYTSIKGSMDQTDDLSIDNKTAWADILANEVAVVVDLVAVAMGN